ncbi:flagellar hook-associated protein FlgK [Simplicispira metamorpha]|uniref:Flagellar hook-associated protein 1 n=1 Tax=Simplicispira metamorpha TaxID=80881 RepID=A0A4R2N3F3_9BURK|nr:flagellar hook-associated protein FlgK [Simplicispira metamorpha]TCP14428.1 flagellar hook-associated protein 1 FlgK [Simplicispira metamorpha]
MSLLNVGSRALLANQAAIQTAGNNIANVNTTGYSRQNVVLATMPGQLTGGGYIGKGVDIQTVLRNHSDLLTRQANAAAATDAGDSARLERLKQLQDVFSGGAAGLGSAINDMMNAFSDVVSSPTDLTARGVVLTRIDETARRMRDGAGRIEEIELAVAEQLKGAVNVVNNLARDLAQVNQEIVRARGNGQAPNDLLDRRDQLTREINKYVQTTQVAADDGSVSVFVGASQPLVLGGTAASLAIGDPQDFGSGSGQKKLLFIPANATAAQAIEMNDSMLGGGQVAGLLRFQNGDLAEGRNLLGRMAVAISEALNSQNKLGLTLDGKPGENLFKTITLANAVPGNKNTSGAKMGVEVADASKLQASSYSFTFTGADSGTVTRQSDGKIFPFANMGELNALMLGQGLRLTDGAAPPATPGAFAGATDKDQFLLTPLQGVASQMQSVQSSPRQLAAANPVNAKMGAANDGSLQLVSLKATGKTWDAALGQVVNTGALTLPPSPVPPATGAGVTLTFNTTAAGTTFTLAGNTATPIDMSATPPKEMTAPYEYIPGKRISIDGWEITLQGSPKTGDTVTVGNAADPQYGDFYQRDAGNASALMALRDAKMFDGASLADGFAGAMAQVGTRTQSAKFAATLSSTIAANLERERAAVSGVNLDEEAARLIQYQQAYQASAKMIQIAQNIFDNLIQSVGR